jgi:hypothetical protein
MIGSIVFEPNSGASPMIPRLSIGVIILLIVAYVVGAKWPQLAARVGLA